MAPVIAALTLRLVVLLNVIAPVLLVHSTVATPLQKVLQLVPTSAIPFIISIIIIGTIQRPSGFSSTLVTSCSASASGAGI